MIAGRMADHDVHRSRRIRCQMDCVSKRKGGDNLDWRQVALVAVTLSTFLLRRPLQAPISSFLADPGRDDLPTSKLAFARRLCPMPLSSLS